MRYRIVTRLRWAHVVSKSENPVSASFHILNLQLRIYNLDSNPVLSHRFVLVIIA
jgi:hypothetical protein